MLFHSQRLFPFQWCTIPTNQWLRLRFQDNLKVLFQLRFHTEKKRWIPANLPISLIPIPFRFQTKIGIIPEWIPIPELEYCITVPLRYFTVMFWSICPLLHWYPLLPKILITLYFLYYTLAQLLSLLYFYFRSGKNPYCQGHRFRLNEQPQDRILQFGMLRFVGLIETS